MAEQEGRALPLGQVGESLVEHSREAFATGGLVRPGPVGGRGAGVEFHGLPVPTIRIDAEVAGDAIEPRRKPHAVRSPCARTAPDPQKGLLGQVGRILRVPGQPVVEGVDAVEMARNQDREGIPVLVLNAGHQLLVGGIVQRRAV